MDYFYVEPEVSGELGANTVINRSVHPPIVKHLHYQFDGWLGDVLLESFPSFVVTDDARRNLENSHVTGARFADVEITTSDQFRELYPKRQLPTFAWLQVVGVASHDDFGTAADGRLIVSNRALEVLQQLELSNALISPL